MTNPIYWYNHDNGCSSMTGSAVVPDGVWPREFDGAYLYSDSACGKILMIPPPLGGGTLEPTELAGGLSAPIDLAFPPTGAEHAVYYILFGNYPNEEVRKIVYTGDGNRAPRAVASATPTDGAIPIAVSFDGGQSFDPDGDPLTYDWDFGDGSPHGSGAQVSHTYSTAGTYTATLTVSDPGAGTDSTSIRIDVGNHAPVPSIATPTASQSFSVGEDLTLTGSATDSEDVTVPDSSLSWEVVKHHATHTHPFLPPTTGNGIHITAPQPEDLYSTTNTYLEIRLTATDSRGRATTVIRDVYPSLVNVSIATKEATGVPVAGLQVNVAGTSLTTPATITGWKSWGMLIDAPSPQTDSAGRGLTFVSWSDGGGQTHTTTLPGNDFTYSAAFTPNYARPRGAALIRVPLVPAYRSCAAPNRFHGAPFAFGSCAPPQQTSPYATLGTGDANGLPAESVGFLRVKAIGGDPSTPADEADMKIEASVTDVLDPTRGFDDYVGSLAAKLRARLTDRRSGTSGSDPATVTDMSIDVPLPCTVTPGTTIGSTCAIATTLDTLSPGAVPEGRRSIWALDGLQVYDGGSDGALSTDDNTLFLTQGVFVP
jgi:PKD repeat protein